MILQELEAKDNAINKQNQIIEELENKLKIASE